MLVWCFYFSCFSTNLNMRSLWSKMATQIPAITCIFLPAERKRTKKGLTLSLRVFYGSCTWKFHWHLIVKNLRYLTPHLASRDETAKTTGFYYFKRKTKAVIRENWQISKLRYEEWLAIKTGGCKNCPEKEGKCAPLQEGSPCGTFLSTSPLFNILCIVTQSPI